MYADILTQYVEKCKREYAEMYYFLQDQVNVRLGIDFRSGRWYDNKNGMGGKTMVHTFSLFGMGIFGIIWFLGFALCFVVFLILLCKGIGQWNQNNRSPRLTVPVTLVAKRTNVSHHRHSNAADPSGIRGHHTVTETSYYVTFQVESGDRMELRVSGSQFGQMVEGDRGMLTFQGTRFLDFRREL